MSEVKKLAALKSGDSYDFWGLDRPKCPHCGEVYNVDDNEAYELYEDGTHEIHCPDCETQFTVTTNVYYSFSTDEQEDDTDESDIGEGVR